MQTALAVTAMLECADYRERRSGRQSEFLMCATSKCAALELSDNDCRMGPQYADQVRKQAEIAAQYVQRCVPLKGRRHSPPDWQDSLPLRKGQHVQRTLVLLQDPRTFLFVYVITNQTWD